MKTFFTFASAFILSTGIATAHDYTIGDLEIMHPMAFETPKMARTGAGFLTITNTGDSDDVLIEVRADFPKVEVHTTEEIDGVAKMMHVEDLPIPAGETVTLAPGGYHVMFMGLSDPLEKGQEIPATLIFENAGEVEIMFNVEVRPESGDTMDHSGH